MEYYIINLSPEPKDIGVKNGIYQINIEEKIMNLNNNYVSLINNLNYKNRAHFLKNQKQILNIENFTIKGKKLKSAKLTDLMGYSPNIYSFKYIYSQKFINILSKYNIGKFNDLNFEIENIYENYFLRYFYRIPIEEVDLKNTYFDRKPWYNELFKLTNIEELNKDNSAHLRILTIPKKYEGLDVISTQIENLLFFSDRLIKNLLEDEISGLKINYDSVKLLFS